MIITIRFTTGEKIQYDMIAIEGFFAHRGRIITTLDGVNPGDWLQELPETNCAW